MEWKSSPQKLYELVEEYLECMYELPFVHTYDPPTN